jgi:Holliday junction resolvase RusA-like endonuclease
VSSPSGAIKASQRVLFQCRVDGKPVPQSRPRVSKWGVYYGKRSKAQRELLTGGFTEARVLDRTGEAFVYPPINFPVSVTLKFSGAPRLADPDNMAKLVLDSMVDAGVLATDAWPTVQELHVYCLAGEGYTEVVVESLT